MCCESWFSSSMGMCVGVFDLPGRREMLMMAPVADVYGIDFKFRFHFHWKNDGD